MVKGYKGYIRVVFSFVLMLYAAGAVLSCSVRYEDNGQKQGDEMPEFVFEDVSMHRVEAGEVKAALKADKIEQYKSSMDAQGAVYGRNVKFVVSGKRAMDGQLNGAAQRDLTIDGDTSGVMGGDRGASGECALLSADTQNEVYSLFGNIRLTLPQGKGGDFVIEADSIRWDGKTEQLTGGMDDTVLIKKTDENGGETTVQGKSFCASAVSGAFAFLGDVAGEMVELAGEAADAAGDGE